MREYGIDNGDGTITVWGTNDDEGGSDHWPIRTESREQNQGGGQSMGDPTPSGLEAWAPQPGYPQRNADGSEVYVVPWLETNSGQMRYETTPLAQYQAQLQKTTPGTKVTGGISAEHRDGLRRAGYPDWANPNLTEADFARISAGAQQGGGAAGGLPSLLNSLYGSNQQYFDFDKQKWAEDLAERKRQSSEDLAERRRQADLQQEAQERALFSNLAQGLLSGAAQLGSRPGDWLSYANYQNQGRNIFDSLYGDKPTPKFGAPSGFSEPGNIQDVLRKLGLIQGDNRMSIPENDNRMRTMEALEQATAPLTGEANRVTTMGAGGDVRVPNPHQINPMVWDSLSNTAKQMILGAAQAGKTESGSWTPEDFLNQLQQSRPSGTAPRSTSFQWAQPGRLF